jgi:hypothetical protein
MVLLLKKRSKVEKLNLDVRSIVESALAIAVERAKRERLEKAIGALLAEMNDVSEDEWVKAVRKCRREGWSL